MQLPPSFPAGWSYRCSVELGKGLLVPVGRSDVKRAAFRVKVLPSGRVERVFADLILDDEDAAREWVKGYETAMMEATRDHPGLPPGPVLLHEWEAIWAFDGNRFRKIK